MKRISQALLRPLAAVLIVCTLLILANQIQRSYDNYTQLMVEQRQQYLLITARAISQTLSLHFSEQLRDIEILTRTPGFLEKFQLYYQNGDDKGLKEYILSYMLAQRQGTARIYLIDNSGKTIYRYSQYPFIEEFDESVLGLEACASRQQSGLGKAFRISDNHYGVILINGIMDGNDYVGTIITVLDMDTLYQQYVAPFNVDRTCEIVVKDEEGNVIMHPSPKMLSFNPFHNIQQLDTLPQYESLNAMLTMQYSQEEGSAIYRSYANGLSLPRDEIVSFSRMHLGGASWYISAIVPYHEVKDFSDSSLSRIGLLGSLILVIIATSIVVIISLQKNRQKLKLETTYLREINHTLEELHQSREQINHYQKLQTLGALAGGIVHEFNNLLTPIIGYSEFIKTQLDPDNEFYEDIDEIYKAGSRAKEIVEQILPFSRKETDSSTYSPVSIDAVLQDSLKMLRMIIPSTISVQTDLPETHCSVYGSTTQLSQVMVNLYTNACQSMENGGTLTVRIRQLTFKELPESFLDASGKRFVCITVSDTGCGIAPEVLPHVFDAFYTTKEADKGTGLGLSVVQNILISHGGYIDVDSTVNEGSRFRVFLPVGNPEVFMPENTIVPHSATVQYGRKLIVIDDEIKILKYMNRRLSSKNCEVDSFSDPEEAFRTMQDAQKYWDLAIIDETMPKCRGSALVRRMRRSGIQIPVLLITGYVERSIVELQQNGMIDGVFIKPIDFVQLEDKIEQLCARREGDRE